MSHLLELLDRAQTPIPSDEDLQTFFAQAARAPFPWVSMSDEWGNLLRAEGLNGQFYLQARSVDAEGVRWWGLGNSESQKMQTPMPLSGRSVKVSPTEKLNLEQVKDAFRCVLKDATLPAHMPKRLLSGEHGRLYMMVLGSNEARPTVGWQDIARRLAAVPEADPIICALSEPGRVLFGIFGVADHMTVTVREYRGDESWERRIAHTEGASGPVQLKLPQGDIEVPGQQVLSRQDMLLVLESLYRFDTPPPGFTWTLA